MDVRNRTPLTGNALARDSRHISTAERAAVKHIAAAAQAMTAVAIQPTIISPPFTLNSLLLRRASVSVAAMLIEPAAHQGGFRCAYLEVQIFKIFRCTRSPRSNNRAGTMFHCRHGGKRKAPGRLSPGPAVPLLTRGLIWDRHANACAQNGAFLGLAPPRRSHLLPLLAHRYSLPYCRTAVREHEPAACICNTTVCCGAELMQATALGLC